MRNPKTTWAGIIVLIATILNAVGQAFGGGHVDIASVGTGIAAGVGLITARDGNDNGKGSDRPQ